MTVGARDKLFTSALMFRFDRRAEVSVKERLEEAISRAPTALQLEAALCLKMFAGNLLGTKTKQKNLGIFYF